MEIKEKYEVTMRSSGDPRIDHILSQTLGLTSEQALDILCSAFAIVAAVSHASNEYILPLVCNAAAHYREQHQKMDTSCEICMVQRCNGRA